MPGWFGALVPPTDIGCTPAPAMLPAHAQGFFLLHYASEWRRHLEKLAALVQAGRLRVQVCTLWCSVCLLPACFPACLPPHVATSRRHASTTPPSALLFRWTPASL